ncbi:sdo1p [Vairimorpha apis BRL 01]|uniref:Sdo1p n=1 Tax=Vairimorpha apis BRL 01 TaxID=1037528 RepID=T0KXR9_9MICR|nr:sdo1p [Vairimorpha apis BRL 01]
MFTPSNVKKFTNISVITLKISSKTFSIPVYPNKLYEYQNNISPLESILVTKTVYKDISKGIKCSLLELKESFNTNNIDLIITEIIKKGHEQKNEATRNFELKKIENQIVDRIRSRVLLNKKFVAVSELKKIIRKFYTYKFTDIKPQANEIINILVSMGYERLPVKILLIEDCEKYKRGILYIDGTEFLNFRKYCEDNHIRYIVKKNITGFEEEII